MKSLLVSILLFSAIGSSAYAGVEVEISAGQSSKTLEGSETNESNTIKSTDLSLAVGYRIKNFLTLGVIASQKNYDLNELSKQVSVVADSFYSDPEVFPGGSPTVDSENSKGSLRGLVYGPQITLAYPGKFFQPYLRVAYQMGTLDSAVEFERSGSYGSAPVGYKIKFEDKRKTNFTQIGLGFRIPFGKFYLSADAAMESMSYETGKSKATQDVRLGDDLYHDELTSDETDKDKGGGSVIKLGIGCEI